MQFSYHPTRSAGLVFQDNRLFPHLNVADNLAFAMNRAPAGWHKLSEVIDTLGVRALLSRAVTELSGGEAKRVAIARTLLNQPKLLMMDEPLNGLISRVKRNSRLPCYIDPTIQTANPLYQPRYRSRASLRPHAGYGVRQSDGSGQHCRGYPATESAFRCRYWHAHGGRYRSCYQRSRPRVLPDAIRINRAYPICADAESIRCRHACACSCPLGMLQWQLLTRD